MTYLMQKSHKGIRSKKTDWTTSKFLQRGYHLEQLIIQMMHQRRTRRYCYCPKMILCFLYLVFFANYILFFKVYWQDFYIMFYFRMDSTIFRIWRAHLLHFLVNLFKHLSTVIFSILSFLLNFYF